MIGKTLGVKLNLVKCSKIFSPLIVTDSSMAEWTTHISDSHQFRHNTNRAMVD